MAHDPDLRDWLPGPPKSPPRAIAWAFARVIGWIAAVLMASVSGVYMMFMYEDYARNLPPRRLICTNNLKQIGIALDGYRSDHGCFPPAYTIDADGRPMHSWRALILPYLESPSPYASYNLGVAWDHPANTTVANFPFGIYLCPSDQDPPDRAAMTNYVMVHGPGRIFDPARDHLTRPDDLTDGAAGTITIVETTQKVRWAAPDDPIRLSAPPDSRHSAGGANVLFADGSVQFWKSTKPAAAFRAALTIAGGEVVPSDDF